MKNSNVSYGKFAQGPRSYSAFDVILLETFIAIDALELATSLAIDRVARWDRTGIPFTLISYPGFELRQDFPLPDAVGYERMIDDALLRCRSQANYTGREQLRGGPITGGIFGDLFGFGLF